MGGRGGEGGRHGSISLSSAGALALESLVMVDFRAEELAMRWYFFAGFAAAIICAVLGTALIIFTIATSRLWTMGVTA